MPDTILARLPGLSCTSPTPPDSVAVAAGAGESRLDIVGSAGRSLPLRRVCQFDSEGKDAVLAGWPGSSLHVMVDVVSKGEERAAGRKESACQARHCCGH